MKYFANFGRTTANSSKLMKQGLYKPKSKTPLTLDFFLKNYLQDFESLIVMWSEILSIYRNLNLLLLLLSFLLLMLLLSLLLTLKMSSWDTLLQMVYKCY